MIRDPHRRARGVTVRSLRAAQDMPLAALAQTAETSTGYLSKVENGHYTASQALTERLATALGVRVEVLTGQLPPIEALRTALGIAPEELADAANLSAARLARIERGSERPHPAELDAIARRLGVDVAALGGDPVEAVGA